MRIKLTPAQAEIAQRHHLQGFTPHTAHIDCDDINSLVAQLQPAYDEIMQRTYSENDAREIFATRALYAKLAKLADQPATPEPTPIEIGATVYLVGDRTAKYRVIKFNTDGSAQVYGGESAQYQSFRDFRIETLTTVQP